jgi:hypothetical protein
MEAPLIHLPCMVRAAYKSLLPIIYNLQPRHLQLACWEVGSIGQQTIAWLEVEQQLGELWSLQQAPYLIHSCLSFPNKKVETFGINGLHVNSCLEDMHYYTNDF